MIMCKYSGWVVSKQDGVLIYGMKCLYMGWGIRLEDGVCVYGMGC